MKLTLPPLFLYNTAEDLAGNLLILVADREEAEEIYSQLIQIPSNNLIILYFPPKDIALFDESSPHPIISLRRIKTLLALIEEKKRKMVIIPYKELLYRVLSAGSLIKSRIKIKKGELLRRDFLIKKLINYGYEPAHRVENHGEISYRGSVVDFFPPEGEKIIRIDYWGDTIEEIKEIDVETYHSLDKLKEVEVIPVKETFLEENAEERLKKKLEEIQKLRKIPHWKEREFIENFSYTFSIPHMEFSISYFHDTVPLFSYLENEKYFVLQSENILNFSGELKELEKEVEKKYREALKNNQFLPDLSEIIARPEEVEQFLKTLSPLTETSLSLCTLFSTLLPLKEENIILFNKSVEKLLRTGYRIIFFYTNTWEKEKLHAFFTSTNEVNFKEIPFTTPGIYLTHCNIYKGYVDERNKIIFIGRENWEEIKKQRLWKIRRGKRKLELTLADIRPGEYVVHEDHGIAIYRGLTTLSGKGDFILLQFANGKVYVPVFKFDKISPYIGEEEPELSLLGTPQWKKLKEKVNESVEKLAAELLKIYAEREVLEGHAFSPPAEIYSAVEESFPFEETPDQENAIEETVKEMMSPRPMERLICGDAGFGKTEVALRAAVKAVEDGKQVAFMAPTTVLSLQHYSLFKERLQGLPIRVELLNRFIPLKKQKEIIRKIASGEINIVIGTHRLLSREINFKDLGVVIIDEEQKFGVRQKEKLRKIKSTVDTLLLTATPIPRTLHSALSGLRAVSVITTPPKGRKEVETKIIEWNSKEIRTGIARELERGGQVFVIFNRIEGLQEIYEAIKSLTPPGTRVTSAHGRMETRELERRILAFYNGEYDVFVSTTIIESGVDIPGANTIFILNAHKFGLSELYQLRGRVGRADVKGYAYLVIPAEEKKNPKVMKKLEVLKSFSKLGSGFKIALKDLELRGAGELLGRKQHGFMNKLGYELYMKMLQRSITKLKVHKEGIREEVEIKTGMAAFIPHYYISDIEERLSYYYHLSTAVNKEEINSVRKEMAEIYGPLPEETQLLIEIYKLKLTASRIGIKEIRITGRRIKIFPSPETKIRLEHLISLRKKNKNFTFTSSYLLWEGDVKDFKFINSVIDELNFLSS